MKVRDFFLANHAEVHDSLCFVSGAFPEWWTVLQLPASERVTFVFLLDYTDDPDETGGFQIEHHEPNLSIEPSTLFALQASRGTTERDIPGAPRLQPVAISSDITFQGIGLHTFTLHRMQIPGSGGLVSLGAIEASVSLWVKLAPGNEAFGRASR